MIRVVDYGLGNVLAFLNVYRRLNVQALAATTPAELESATKIVLPGVGAFDHAMELLNGSAMRDTLEALVLNKRVPVLGVCVGMQILANASDEGTARGLGWIPGRVRAFRSALQEALPLPHMGWNDVRAAAGSKLFQGLETESRFYFLHSYYFQCDEPRDAAALSRYGIDFACAVSAGNIHGVQFHPEKSHHFGTQLLKNFAEL